LPEATQLIKVTTIKNITLMKKILVIINKNWETEPVLNALTNPKLRPAALPFPEVINTPCDGDNRMSQPRAVFSLPREGEEPLQVVVRCIEDLMATGVNTSSSLEKYKVLPQAIAADAADLLVAYGPLSAAMAEAARQKGLQTIHCQAAEEVVEYLRQNVRPGDVVLAKASHAMKLDDVLKQLYAALPNA